MGSTPAGKASHQTVGQRQRRGILRLDQFLPLGLAMLGTLLAICAFYYVHSLGKQGSSRLNLPQETAQVDGSFAAWTVLGIGLSYTALATTCLVIARRKFRRADIAAADGSITPDSISDHFHLLEALPWAVFFYDRSYRLQWMNSTAREFARINQKDYAELPCHMAWTDSPTPCESCTMRPSSRTDSEARVCHAFRTADGRQWSSLASPVRDEHGEIMGVLKVGRDVSEQVATSRALKQERATFERILDQNPSSTAVFSPDGRFVRGNPAFFRLFGVREDAMLGNDYVLFEDPILLENGLRDDLDRIRAGQVVDIPPVRFNASRVVSSAIDRTVFIAGRVFPILDRDGAIESIIVTHEDFTRRDQIEKELQASQERLVLALDPAIEGLWDFDVARGKVNYFSSRCFTMLGWDPQELPHTFETWVQLLHPEDRLWVEGLAGSILTEGREQAVEYRMVHKEGGYRWISSRGRVVEKDAGGKPLRMIGTHVDVTLRREAETRVQELQTELAHASRLSTMGELAAGFAHELNQPLTAIASYSRAAIRNIDGDRVTVDDIRPTLTKIGEQAERAGDVIRSLRSYIRPTGALVQSSHRTDVNECAREAIMLLEHETRRSNIRIELSLETGLSDVSIGRIELVQVFVNLVLNAIEALASAERGDRELGIQTAAADQGNIMVRVTDNGPGLSRATAEQIFEPFITTKPDGMGVGLAICRRILDKHGGHLSAASNDSGGAVFTFLLCPAHGRNKHGN